MSKRFPEYKGLDLPKLNNEVLKMWDDNNTFHRSLRSRDGKGEFIFYEGPPSANGMPGIHHVMSRAIKDAICRYKTLQGYEVKRKAGWDTHGLPVELGVEKSLGITKEDIGTKISVDEYNAACRKDVMKYTDAWEDLTRHMGYWIDMDNPYVTYDNRYIETLWWLLKELYKKGLLYEGYTIQPFSPAAGTGLSSHELNMPGCYRDVKDTTCIALFSVIRNDKSKFLFSGIDTEGVKIMAWTTTPWTLPSNTALAVGPEIKYARVHTTNPYTSEPITVILAEELIPVIFAPDKKLEYTVNGTYKGSQLKGIDYEQLIDWVNPGEGAFRVITGDFVTTVDGTGIVHIAPTFGADDYRAGREHGVPPLLVLMSDGFEGPLVDRRGRMVPLADLDQAFIATHVNTDTYGPFAGRYVKNEYDETLTEADATLDVDIAVMLKQSGKAFRIEKQVHNYPHCWRTDKPVLYYPLDSWFIRTTALRDRMIELNNTINWKPESTGTGRFGKWLENLVDWNLSRSRYWGTPLPIWMTEDRQEEICIGSLAELKIEITRSIDAGYMFHNPLANFVEGDNSLENYSLLDLHRPYVDDIILVSKTGRPMKRETDLIDVWFDSGAMPYAQAHYPFENKGNFTDVFPADFIAEGVDQTRGWFFTLHAIATMISDSVSYKNIISNGLVLDKNGNKMSKRLGNAVDPFVTIDQHGADPVRWYMLTNAQPWDIVGYVGNAMFFSRFLVQWIASERAKKSVVPPIFWHLSIAGSLILLAYSIHINKLVLILAYAPNVAKNPDNAQALSDGWYKYFGFRVLPEDIYCDGCRAEEPKLIDKQCPVRPCVIAWGLEHCGECAAYACDKLSLRIVDRSLWEGMDIPEADYERFIRPYENKRRFEAMRHSAQGDDLSSS